ncbi:MAG: hypothetical protein QF681_02630 [Vicinamibacterales bacterium]|jgi:hypothetical protein|nr:hypothetical protein [Vicinamibacterales bacterium]
MLTKPIAVVGLATGIIVAAAAGAYLGVRQNAEDPVQLVETDARHAEDHLTPVEPTVLAPAVEATEAVVDNEEEDTLDPAVTNETRAPSPVPDTRPQQPVVRPAPTPPPSPAPAEQVSLPTASEAESAASETTTAPVVEAVAESPLVDRPSAETARADLPTIEGWARPESAESSQELDTVPEPIASTSSITDAASINAPAPDAPVTPTTTFVELEIAADSVIGLQVDTPVSTRTAEVEDTVEARVTRNVLVADEVAVPAGTRALGSVVLVEKVGKLRGAARLGVRFHTLVMEDGLQVPIATETIYREGRARGSDSASKIGGAAVGGAILGAIFGGSRGAAIGGSIGAAGGTAAALNSDGDPAGLPPGTMLTVRLSRPVVIGIEQ